MADDLSLGFFKRKVKTGTDIYEDNLCVSEGNESATFPGSAITITNSAATAQRQVCPVERTWQLTKVACRETTAVVNAGSDVGTILVSTAQQGTAAANLTDLVTITVSTGTFTGATVNSVDINFNAVNIMGGAYLVLRHTQATGGSAAGVIATSVFHREKAIQSGS